MMSRAMFWMMALLAGLAGQVARGQALIEAVQDEFLEVLRDRPEQMLEQVGEVILGYGRDGRIDAAGIDDMIAVRRAAVRATALRRLGVADLDNDGDVTRREVGIVMPALTASLRARLVMSQRQADADGDGRASAQEMRGWAQAIARAALDARQADGLRRLMLLDQNGDGWVDIHEAAQVIDRYREGS